MIIKKPYAFLIKHFRIIHLVLTVLVLYLLTKTHSIFIFFNDYVKNGFYTYSNNLTTSYINLYMFFALIFVIVIASFVYLLMRWKKKSRVLYISICLFYLVLFVGFLFYFNVFTSILNVTLDVRTVRAYRDIIVILYLPQYLFLGFGVVRAIGFDIKKFDFKKDLEELDIAEEDQEEIEVTFGQNNYKYKRKIRRTFRMLKYYALENKFFFGVIVGTLSLIIVFFVYTNINIFGKKYKESEYFDVNGVIFRVMESYVTDIDYKGNTILEGKKYVVIKVSMDNTNTGRVTLSTESLRLVLNDEVYFPVFSKSEYFRDLGEGYYKNTLYPGEQYEFLMVFEIPYDEKVNKPMFRLVDSISLLKGELAAKYKDVSINPINYMDKGDAKNYTIDNAVSFEDSTLSNSDFVINTYEIGDAFTELYTYCISKCYTGRKEIIAETLGREIRTILKLNFDLDLDSSLYVNRYLTSNSNFISMFGTIVYSVNGNEKVYTPVIKSLDDIVTKNVYMEVPDEVKRADSIKLKLSIRNQEYVISLK